MHEKHIDYISLKAMLYIFYLERVKLENNCLIK